MNVTRPPVGLSRRGRPGRARRDSNINFFTTVREGTKVPPYKRSGNKRKKDEEAQRTEPAPANALRTEFGRLWEQRTVTSVQGIASTLVSREEGAFFGQTVSPLESAQVSSSFPGPLLPTYVSNYSSEELPPPLEPQIDQSVLQNEILWEVEQETGGGGRRVLLENRGSSVHPKRQKRSTSGGWSTSVQVVASTSEEGRSLPTTSTSGIQEGPTSSVSQFRTPLPPKRNLFTTPQATKESITSSTARYQQIFRTPPSVCYRNLPPPTPVLFRRPPKDDEERACASKSTPSVLKTPKTSKTSLSKSNTTSRTEDDYIVLALTGGRGCAVGEVGLAAMDIQRPTLLLCQMSDTQTYSKTLAKINVVNPAELLVPHTFQTQQNQSKIFDILCEQFSNTKVVAVRRQYFAEKEGLQCIRTLCLPEYSSVELIVIRKFYALAAAAALIKYIEVEHNVVFAPKSLRIEFHCAEGVVSMDLETVRRLELVYANIHDLGADKYSLMGIVNHTRTLGGSRRLRALLLQPPSRPSTIHRRLNTVQFLLGESHFLKSLQVILSKLNDVEKLLWLCTKTPDFKKERRTAENMTNFVLLLKVTLETLPQLRELLSESNFDYFSSIRDDLCDARFENMYKRIKETINEDAKVGKGYSASEMQRCFAIKEGLNGLLDVARSTYSQLIVNVQEIIKSLAEEHKLVLKMVQSYDHGFHAQLVLPKNCDAIDESALPETFTEVKKTGNTIKFTTKEIYSLNVRIIRAIQEINLISNVIMYDLIQDLRADTECLYRMCEYIAELDVLASLAQTSSVANYTKPKFGDKLCIIGARHPILDCIDQTTPTPNDVYASPSKNFNIVTGPNMGGKTVYVLMIPLLQIMAQLGCYVPAVSAEFRITDHIAVRKGYGDSIECNASSFTLEIKELMYITKSVTPTSLVIIDELCAGTTNEEGTAMAWAFCEEFLVKPIFTFLTTHFHFITNLSKVFNNVTNFYTEAIIREDLPYGRLTYTHRLLPGVTNISDYGIRLMKVMPFPQEVKENAMRIADQIKAKREASLPLVKPVNPSVLAGMEKIERIEGFMNNLYALSQSDEWSVDIVKELQKMAIEQILSDDSDDQEEERETIRLKGRRKEVGIAGSSVRDENQSVGTSAMKEKSSDLLYTEDKRGLESSAKEGESSEDPNSPLPLLLTTPPGSSVREQSVRGQDEENSLLLRQRRQGSTVTEPSDRGQDERNSPLLLLLTTPPNYPTTPPFNSPTPGPSTNVGFFNF